MTYHLAEIIILENALREAISTVNHLHDCLTNPEFAAYAYPEETARRLEEWGKLVGPNVNCHHSSFVADCQACQLWKFRRYSLKAAQETLNGSKLPEKEG